MSDLISRQAAIDAIYHHLPDKTMAEITQMLHEVPSAAPERKKGEWLLFDGYRCSRCNYKLQTTGIPMYCPNCGAEMRKEREE